MTGLFLVALRFFGSPVGKWLLAVAGALTVLAGLYFWIDHRGYARGVASVQQQIDDPKTGWRARLSACESAKGVAVGAVGTQNTATEAKAADDAASRSRAAAAVTKASTQDQKAAGLAATMDQPVSHAATLPPSPTCLIPNDVAETLIELDRRAQGR